ncbi:hypothetical protein BHE74_00002847 [Ensete ventricosum]|nr:hypothetical protein BHE74_00002847 [Ensete ventricosum]
MRRAWLEVTTTARGADSNDRGTNALRQQEAEAALLCVDGEEEGVGGSIKAKEVRVRSSSRKQRRGCCVPVQRKEWPIAASIEARVRAG